MREALAELAASGKESVRDSDAKRKMLELDPSFEEAELGFNKFSRFLRQAHDHEIVDLKKQDGGRYEIRLPEQAPGPEAPDARRTPDGRKTPDAQPSSEVAPKEAPDAKREPAELEAIVRRLGVRRGGRRGPPRGEDQPTLFAGQVVSQPGGGEGRTEDTSDADASRRGHAPGSRRSPEVGGRDDAKEAMVGTVPAPSGEKLDLESLGLPTSPDSMVRYLMNSYKGIGQKTAETLVEKFGPGLFEVLQNEPHRLEDVVAKGRIAQILEGWSADLARRQQGGEDDPPPVEKKPSGRRPRRSSRRGGRDKRNDAPSE